MIGKVKFVKHTLPRLNIRNFFAILGWKDNCEYFRLVILKQWMASKARFDCLVKLRISFAIYLRATREKMASWFAFVASEEITQINFLWRELSHCFSKYLR